MPETMREWGIFVAGLCAVGVLFGLVLSERPTRSSQTAPQTAGLGEPAGTRSGSGTPTTASTASGQPRTTPPSLASRSNSTSAVRLLVNASRGDSWIMVRSGSATGSILYQGILTKGRSVRLAGRLLWVRVGASANLDARVNGRSVKLLAGTFTALLTPSGLKRTP